ncbi:MAG TPA: STT3 domain-containing protein [Methanobacteriaceae archaeon]|nr:STT3 domain-containing protein [Methanobacteriaceae archaeon]
MKADELFNKLKPLIIIILLFSIVFFLRGQAVNLSSLPDQSKALFQDDNGLPYFSEMDSYYNYRLTSNYLAHGYLGDIKKNGTDWDLHSYFPPGRSAEYPPLIVYVTAWIYKFLNLFGTIPLIVVSYWVPAVIGSLCVIPAYFLVSRLTNDYGGITAGLLAGLAPSYFSHNFAGFFDTDMFNVLLPLMIVWMFIESIRADEFRNKAIFAALAAIFMLIFSMAWEGWWYLFYIIVGATVVYLIISRYLLGMDTIKPRDDFASLKDWILNQPIILPLLIFLVLSTVLMVIWMGGSFFNALLEPLGASQLQSATTAATGSYPNVYVSVAELQIPSITDIVNGVGGLLAFIFGIISVFWLLWKLKPSDPKNKRNIKKKPRRKDRRRKREAQKVATDEKVMVETGPDQRKTYLFMAVLLAVWFVVTAYAMTKGVRFIEAFAIPISLGAGIFVGFVREYLEGQIKAPSYRVIVMALLVAVMVFTPITKDYASSNSVIPGTDDSMVNSLNWIKNNTANNTVIISWWDFGHLFTAVGDRPVTFDGGSQNTPRAYWVGKALFTNNETLSAGILQMLASSGDLGYQTLNNYTKDTGKSVEILEKTLGLDKTAALNIMTTQYGLTSEQAQNVLKYTHPDNPTPTVFITSFDMAGKAGWWSYFGSWNFKNNTGQNFVYSVAQANASVQNNTLVLQADNGVVAQISSNNVTAGIMTDKNKVVAPHKVTLIENNTVMSQVVSNQSSFSILIIKEGDMYLAIAMNKELEDSMFTRMFFMQGQGLTRFKPIYAQPGVIVWNVT